MQELTATGRTWACVLGRLEATFPNRLSGSVHHMIRADLHRTDQRLHVKASAARQYTVYFPDAAAHRAQEALDECDIQADHQEDGEDRTHAVRGMRGHRLPMGADGDPG